MKFHMPLIITMIILISALQISAQPFGNRKGMGGRDKGCRIDNLNLTEEQLSKINPIRENHYKNVGELRDELDRLRIDKRSMFRTSDINKNDYLSLEKKMSQLREKIALSGAEFRMEIYEILTDDQKKELNKENKGNRSGAFFKNQNRRGICW
jgi:Spy/CpxP family protein refolding chaperone